MLKISVITSLFNCTKYITGYFSAVEKIVNKEECEFLLLHNAPKPEELTIIEKEIKNKPWFKHIIISEREGLYVTWNRGVKLANGKYCAIWNVDDVRFSDSLILQAEALDNNPDCGLVTGYLNGTNVYGEIGDRFHKHDSFLKKPEEVYRSCLMGCFPMWRKSVHNTVGYFDEQFKCVSDFDFQIRVVQYYKLFCVPHSLGIYLENDKNKISSNGLQIYENNIVYLRYGVYDKIVLHLVFSALKKYNKNEIIYFGIKHRQSHLTTFSLSSITTGLLIAIFKSPKQITRDIYTAIK